MSVEKIQRDLTNLFNYPSDPNPTTQADYINAVKNWVGIIVNLVDCGLWQPETAYSVGAIVRTPSLPVFALKCITAGTSDLVEPDYTDVSEGDTIQDNDVEWIVCTINTENSDSKANVDASNIGVNAEIDNSDLWGSAIGGGEIAEDDGKLVTGGTVYAVTSGLASDIADNTDDIATNTANISQNTTDIDIADKRISNIEKLLQGNLYDYQTDTDSAYTKTVPSGAMPYAGLESLGGKTVVWNKINKVPTSYIINSGSLDGVTVTITDGVLNVVGTPTEDVNFNLSPGTRTIPANHKLLFTRTSGGFGWSRIGFGSMGDVDAFFHTYSSNFSAGIKVFLTAGTTYNFSAKFNIFDLTLLYGAGNEPSTVAEFQQMFPASYYPYNAGTLLSAGVTEVVSKKADTTTIATYPIPASIQSLTGYGWSAGTVFNYIDYERKVFVKRVGGFADIGSKVFYRNSANQFYCDLLAVEKGKIQTVNAISTQYAVSATGAYGKTADKTFSVRYGSIYFYDTAYDDATAFKSAMDGVSLFYELDTPIETDISAYLTDDNLIEVEVGGTLVFQNSNGTDYQIPVPSSETFMVDLQSAL